MKKIITLVLLLLLLFFAYFSFNKKSSFIEYKLDNKTYKLLTAKNSTEWQKGLMFYKKPVDFDGMIFIFPDKQYRTFWNKNTYLDLDIYWMEDDKIIGKSFLPSILKSKETVTIKSSEKVNKVVELIK
ncbi:MAG: DUF192 domain-containing protein [Candidatus Roizmanbacteria bacterium]|nr:DUF192 domain-containing protein [Candidatus Roizmanbacteria bacterium]